MERLQKAIELAVKFHANQFRKEHNAAGCRIPFIVHPMQVMKLVFDWGAGTPANLAAAICHDMLEDTDVTDDQLISVIGNDAYQIVNELTFHEQGADPRDKQEQKNAYLQTFATKSVNALVIKLADRACNVQDFINGGDGKYASKYARKAQPLYDAVMDRIDEIESVYGLKTRQIVHHVLGELLVASLSAELAGV